MIFPALVSLGRVALQGEEAREKTAFANEHQNKHVRSSQNASSSDNSTGGHQRWEVRYHKGASLSDLQQPPEEPDIATYTGLGMAVPVPMASSGQSNTSDDVSTVPPQ